MLEVCSGVTNEKEKDEGSKRPGRTLVQAPGETGAPLCPKCSSVCSWFEPSGSAVVCE